MSVLGSKALDFALDSLGLGEEGGNNRGPHVKRWCRKEGSPWCAGFVATNLLDAAVNLKMPLPKYATGAKRLAEGLLTYPGAKKVGVDELFPGDIALYRRGGNSANGHIGHVLLRSDLGYVNIEGNVGPIPAVVQPIFHYYTDKNFLYGVRLP